MTISRRKFFGLTAGAAGVAAAGALAQASEPRYEHTICYYVDDVEWQANWAEYRYVGRTRYSFDLPNSTLAEAQAKAEQIGGWVQGYEGPRGWVRFDAP